MAPLSTLLEAGTEVVLENRGVSSLVPFHSHHGDQQLPGQLELKPLFCVLEGWLST